jgi:hypothetical protein
MKAASLSLLVLRSSRLEAMRTFYEALGLTFVEEKHGAGPVHYSAQLGSTVLEIYPGETSPPITEASWTALAATVVRKHLD